MGYDINTSHPNKERLEEIHEFIDECSSLPEDDDLRLTYMQKLRQKSIKFSLYKDDKLLEFLKQIVYNSKDKHIILESLYVLHILILTSKSEHDRYFMEYIHKEYFPLLKQQLEMREEFL